MVKDTNTCFTAKQTNTCFTAKQILLYMYAPCTELAWVITGMLLSFCMHDFRAPCYYDTVFGRMPMKIDCLIHNLKKAKPNEVHSIANIKLAKKGMGENGLINFLCWTPSVIDSEFNL